jgi:hypothetical protein
MNIPQRIRSFTVLAVAAAASLGVVAQVADKSVAVEAVPVVPAFNQWVDTVAVAPEPVPGASITTVPMMLVAVPAPASYEPWPVVVGSPELPLIGAGVNQPSRAWGSSFNYQGMHVRLLVLDAAGRRIEARPVNSLPRPGERFRVRVTATFDAVADVGLVKGEPWSSHRAGQLYPARGMSVHMNAGETVELPLEQGRFFVMGPNVHERLLLSVRHAQALGDVRTQQPAYRIDGKSGSNYLQLVPRGQAPAMEQLLAVAAR